MSDLTLEGEESLLFDAVGLLEKATGEDGVDVCSMSRLQLRQTTLRRFHLFQDTLY